MTLNLNVARPRGRPATPLYYEVTREIGESDLHLLEARAGIRPPALERITDRHHALARLMASGVRDREAAMIVGYTPERVTMLKASPAFQELLSIYRETVNLEFAAVHEHLAGLSKDALLELRQRIEESPAKFTNAELLKIITDTVDRTIRDPLERGDLPTRIELVVPDDDRENSAPAQGA